MFERDIVLPIFWIVRRWNTKWFIVNMECVSEMEKWQIEVFLIL